MRTILKPSGDDSFFKDAIRDLVIVVAGILAALWLESWWQGQLDRQEERQILSSLRTEFEASNTDLADVMRSKSATIDRITVAMTLVAGPVNDDTRAQLLSTRVGGPRFFDTRSGQLTSVINSGQLGLISSDELRGLIADWPGLVADMDFERDIFIEQNTHSWGATHNKYMTTSDNTLEPNVDALMNNLEYFNQLRGYRGLLNRMLEESQTVFDTTEKIIELIDSELGDQ